MDTQATGSASANAGVFKLKAVTAGYWKALIWLDVAIPVVYLAAKFIFDRPTEYTYGHLLVDYHFGPTKRALIGAALSLFSSHIPPQTVYILGAVMIVVTVVLFLCAFHRIFGFSTANLPVFAFVAGSPFFIKNFVKTIGYFDIYGCALAFALLLLSAESFAFVLLAAFGSGLLLLVHQVHALLYIPTIVSIVVLRYFRAQRRSKTTIALAALLLAALAAEFLYVQVAMAPHASPGEFAAHLVSRTTDPAYTAGVSRISEIWYRTLSQELIDTANEFKKNTREMWFFVLLIVLHAPLARYGYRLIQSVRVPDRRMIYAMLAGITAAYFILFATAFDYSRWVSSWAVCMLLMLHAVRQMSGADKPAPIPLQSKSAFVMALILSFVPRVGILRPLS